MAAHHTSVETIEATLREVALAHGYSKEISIGTRFLEDLGLDSLSRIEFLRRLERALKRDLSDPSFARANTIDELIRCLDQDIQSLPSGAVSRGIQANESEDPELLEIRKELESFTTLPELLKFWAEKKPSRTHVIFVEGRAVERRTYFELNQSVTACAYHLASLGLGKGDRVAMMLPTGIPFLCWYMGILVAGGVPVPMYPPVQLERLEEHLRKQEGIIRSSQAKIFIGSREIDSLRKVLLLHCPTVVESINGDEIPERKPAVLLPHPSAEDLALVQYTSGSTGDPKGVMLSHRNLLSNIFAMGRSIEIQPHDLCVSWLPLYHDMGLIGAWLGSLVYGVPLVLTSPLSFLAKPVTWLKLISEYRATISAGPNFAFDLCAHKLTEEELQGVDLSSWRVALNGAEPVRANTIRAFSKRFAPYGFSAQAMKPVYGLAESSLGVLFPSHGMGPRIESVRRDVFEASGKVMPSLTSSQKTLQFVSCGKPLPDHFVRLVSEAGAEVGERQVGLLQFRGPSSSAGYLGNEAATKRLCDNEWRNSGDFAFRVHDEYFITGRQKDLIIKAGRNIYPQDLEEAAQNVPGVRKGCVAAFASSHDQSSGEKLVVIAETRESDTAGRQAIREGISREILSASGVAPDLIVLVPPKVIPKTSSGKLRRAETKKRFEDGSLKPAKSQIRQLTKIMLQSWPALCATLRRELGHSMYGLWCWFILLVCLIPFLLMMYMPGPLRTKRKVARGCARIALNLCGLKPRVEGEVQLSPSMGSILVSNHQSYLDALVCTAILPPDFTFVAKGELSTSEFSRFILGKLGVYFVTRYSAEHAEREAKEIAHRARKGENFIFFPEGTFQRAAGILPFQMGAYIVAVRSAASVTTMGICGTRKVLPDGAWMPYHEPIKIIFGAKHIPRNDTFDEAANLKRTTRDEIIRYVGEPDLG